MVMNRVARYVESARPARDPAPSGCLQTCQSHHRHPFLARSGLGTFLGRQLNAHHGTSPELLDSCFLSAILKRLLKKDGLYMGRLRAYDENAVLDRAMHAFRRKGYQAVSIRDLEAATGLKAGSLYNSFGDKAGVFNAAFAHYNRTVLQHRLSHHAPAEASLQGLRELFLSLLKEPNDESYGCLITNSAVELGSEDGPHTGVGEGMRILAAAFAERLDAARRAGFLRGTSDPMEGALKLLALYQGILVLVRAGCDKAGLERLILNEFDTLEISHDT
jgi:TetR/AcrR family transcriptional repressor of nem operon